MDRWLRDYPQRKVLSASLAGPRPIDPDRLRHIDLDRTLLYWQDAWVPEARCPQCAEGRSLPTHKQTASEEMFLQSLLGFVDFALWPRPHRSHRLVPRRVRSSPVRERRCVPDFTWPELAVIVEIDGGVHGDLEVRRADALKRNWLRAHGWSHLAFTNEQVRDRLDAVVDDVVVALLRARERLAVFQAELSMSWLGTESAPRWLPPAYTYSMSAEGCKYCGRTHCRTTLVPRPYGN